MEAAHQTGDIRLSQIVSALSYALDLTEGQPMGHAIRSCVFGMRIASEMGLSVQQKSDLYYALLIKDAGCSSNATRMCEIIGGDDLQAKRAVKLVDWTTVNLSSLKYAVDYIRQGQSIWSRIGGILKSALHRDRQQSELVQIRCDRGATIARLMGFPETTAEAIRSLDEHWNGQGYPDRLRGHEIPLLGRILNLAQTLEVFWASHGMETAAQVVRERSGRWFDPQLVRVAEAVTRAPGLDQELHKAHETIESFEPKAHEGVAEEERIDSICEAFAEVIDAKSHYTFQHSRGVTAAAVGIAREMALPDRQIVMIRRAALLHDIGKLGVPNTILEKPSRLTDEEMDVVRLHPEYTQKILERIPSFRQLAGVASAHHERLDGTGYPYRLEAPQLCKSARIIAVADVFDALSANRPYRNGLPVENVFTILHEDAPHALDPECLEALRGWVDDGQRTEDLRQLEEALSIPAAPRLRTRTAVTTAEEALRVF